VELGEATFQGPGAHALKTDDGTYASDGTGDVRVPQIKAGAAPRETQICYTGGSSPEIHATFSIIPTLTSPVAAQIRIEGTQRNRSGTLIYEQDVVLNGSSVTETFTTPDTLKQLIDSTTYDLTWKLSLDGGSSSSVVDTTANRLFVTAGTPAGGASATRMEWDCGVAKDCANQSSCADKIHDAIAGDDVDPPFEQSDFEQSEKVSTGSGWMLLDGETYGLCNGQAALMAAAMGLLGY
jgi:hypothetical protein